MKLNKNSPLYLGFVLFAFCAICAFALAAVNKVTAPIIKQIQEENTKIALKEVAAEADDFVKLELTEAETALAKEAYRIMDGGKETGYCVLTEPMGFGGAMSLMVGVTDEGTVLGVKIISLKETPGLGTKADDETWLSQFVLKKGQLAVTKNATAADNEIVAISGATVSSKAVTDGVQKAIDFVAGRVK